MCADYFNLKCTDKINFSDGIFNVEFWLTSLTGDTLPCGWVDTADP